ncbi:unnamed protein product [Symbiodinium sp. CCMP2592]|nr:unnamed protein product [Symbiodinium sp. CCMP2592]
MHGVATTVHTDVVLLRSHHSYSARPRLHMGKDQRGKWQQPQGGYGGWQQDSWSGKGYGKDRPQQPRKPKENKPEAVQFPTLEMMTAPSKKAGSSRRPTEEEDSDGQSTSRLDLDKEEDDPEEDCDDSSSTRVPDSWTTQPVPWSLEWFRPSLDGLPLKPATTAALAQTISCEELLSRPRDPGELEVHLYTDGSAAAGHSRSGYAVTILLRLGVFAAVFGLLGEQLIGREGSLWPLEAPAALRSEQIALVAAMLWVLQFRAFVSELNCTIFFDCMAAGYATNGRWQAPDQFGVQAHLLEMFLREQPGVTIHMEHVKGHSGDPWNELTDVAAKAAANGVGHFGCVPEEVGHEFLSLDLSWLAAEVRARRDSALPIKKGCLEWGEFVDDGYRLAPGLVGPYLEAQLDIADFNVVMFQETKTGTKGMMCYGGKPLLVDEHDITVVEEGPRLLILKVAAAGIRFMNDLDKSFRGFKGADLVLCGVDLNGRLPCGIEGATGDREAGKPDAIGRQFAQLLTKYKLWAPSTFSHLHHGEDNTFVHPTGSQHRIDYMIVGGGAACLRAESAVYVDFDTGAPREDHRLVGVSLHGICRGTVNRASLCRPAYDREKIMSEEGRRLLEQACQDFVQPDWTVSPDSHCQMIQQMLHAMLQRHFLVDRTSGRASFMPPEVWKVREARLKLKKATRGRLTLWLDLVAWAFRQLRDQVDRGMVEVVMQVVNRQGLLYQVSAAAIRFAAMRIKRGLAQARQAFIRTMLTEGHQGSSQVLRRIKKAGLGGSKARARCRPLPALLQPGTGLQVGDRAGYDQVWLEHFGAQEQGTIVAIGDFIEEAATPIPCDEVGWSLSYLPSRIEVQNLLRAVPRGKAAGLDNVPGEVLASAHVGLTPILHALYTKAMVLAKQPTQWRGGILYEAYKNAGASNDVANFRSLFVSSTVGKCYHRLIKNKVHEQTQGSLHPLYCGPRQRAPVLFPELYILSHVRRCCKQGLNYAVLYLDTKSAYYSIARELVTGDIRRDSTVIEIFRRFNLGPEALQELMTAVADEGAMAEADVPAALQQTVRDLHHCTWFTTRYTDGARVCQTLRGSRPGESFADTIFAYIYSKILCAIYEAATAEDLAFTLPLDPETGPFGSAGGSSEQPSWDATWADDSAFPTAAEDSEVLLRKITRLTAVVLGTCQAHCLEPNMKAGKTSLMIGLRGKGSTRAKRRYFAGGSPVLQIEEIGAAVHVVPQYRHLGGYLDTRNLMMVEARHRIAMATQAYDASAKLLLNRRDLDMSVRAGILHSVVTASFFNIALWVEKGKAWAVLENAYSRLVRRLLCTVVRGERLFRVVPQLAHIATGCWKLRFVARRARLSFLASLAQSGPDLLWAALQNEGEWLQQVCGDLRWLVGQDRAIWPEAAHDQECGNDLVLVCHWAMLRALRRHEPQAVARSVWRCWACEVTFSTKAKLSVHLFKTHGRVAAYRQFLHGTICEACGKQFWSGRRLAAHLRASRPCVSTLRRQRRPVENVQPGFGSRAMRKDDVENYTLSAPELHFMPIAGEGEDRWFGPQKQFYEAVCDAAFSAGSGGEFRSRLLAAVKAFPVYPTEISEVLEVLLDEIVAVNNSHEDRQWDATTVEEMLLACKEIVSGTRVEVVIAPNEVTSDAFDEFQKNYHDIGWQSEVACRLASHGTRACTLFILPTLWEAEWRKVREGLAFSAVLDEPLELLPKPLKEAWLEIAAGRPVKIRAPSAFWGHPLAGPFGPCKEAVHSN